MMVHTKSEASLLEQIQTRVAEAEDRGDTVEYVTLSSLEYAALRQEEACRYLVAPPSSGPSDTRAFRVRPGFRSPDGGDRVLLHSVARVVGIPAFVVPYYAEAA